MGQEELPPSIGPDNGNNDYYRIIVSKHIQLFQNLIFGPDYGRGLLVPRGHM